MFKRLEINEERDLEHLVINDPESIEKGLVHLDHQIATNRKFLDVLMVDADGVLVVIELKVGEDDGMLFQAMEYYDWVSSNRDRLARQFGKRAKIVVAEDPRIILIASRFSDRLKRAIRYFEPSITLMEYAYLETKSKEVGLFCREVPFEAEEIYAPPVSLENVFSYVNQPTAKEAGERIHTELCKIANGVESIPRNGYIRYKYKNRFIGSLSLKRTFVRVWVKINENDEWDELKAANLRDWSSKKGKILKSFLKRYRSVGGE